MAKIIHIPVKVFPDGEQWLMLDSILGKRVVMRAHEINLKQAIDYDTHHCPEAHARGSVKCRAKSWDISERIVAHP